MCLLSCQGFDRNIGDQLRRFVIATAARIRQPGQVDGRTNAAIWGPGDLGGPFGDLSAQGPQIRTGLFCVDCRRFGDLGDLEAGFRYARVRKIQKFSFTRNFFFFRISRAKIPSKVPKVPNFSETDWINGA
jgi:hypothetical protein